MYTTSLKTWARAIAIDGILIGALIAGAIYHVPYTLEVSVFFMWWISVLGIIFGLLIIGFLVFEPHGLAEVWRRIRRFFHLWPFRN